MKEALKDILYGAKGLELHLRDWAAGLCLDGESRRRAKEAKLLVEAHALEKGLCLQSLPPDWGQKRAKRLLKALDTAEPSFGKEQAIRVLGAYAKASGWEPERPLPTLKGEAGLRPYEPLPPGLPLEELATRRRSLRDFEPRVVERTLVEQAAEMLRHCPTACNRQPLRLYCSGSLEQAVQWNALLLGSRGFSAPPPNIAVLSCDRAAFRGQEAFQCYVNGGLGLGVLCFALESLGLGCCILQQLPFSPGEKKLRALLGAGKSEVFIGAIAFGYGKAGAPCPCSQRRPLREILRFPQEP